MNFENWSGHYGARAPKEITPQKILSLYSPCLTLSSRDFDSKTALSF